MAQYASIQDLRDEGLPPEALDGIDGRELNKALKRTGDFMDTYIRQKNTLPLSGALSDATSTPPGLNTFPGEIVRCNVILASRDLLRWRGYNPDEFDEDFRLSVAECVSWLKELAKGSVSLDDTADATPNINEGAPKVKTNAAGTVHTAPDGRVRGW